MDYLHRREARMMLRDAATARASQFQKGDYINWRRSVQQEA